MVLLDDNHRGSGRVGGVYFNPESGALYLMGDTIDGSHFDLVRMCESSRLNSERVDPHFYFSSRANKS